MVWPAPNGDSAGWLERVCLGRGGEVTATERTEEARIRRQILRHFYHKFGEIVIFVDEHIQFNLQYATRQYTRSCSSDKWKEVAQSTDDR
jgi:hypothetical protein